MSYFVFGCKDSAFLAESIERGQYLTFYDLIDYEAFVRKCEK